MIYSHWFAGTVPTSLPAFSLYVVDDHAIIRRGIKELVRQHFTITTIAEASSRNEVMAHMGSGPADLVLLDLQLSDGNALDLVPILREHGFRHVIVYSMSAERIYASQAIARGAAGFVSKADDEHDLIGAITIVRSGGIYLSPTMEAMAKSASRSAPGDPFAELSEREVDVMNALLTGAGVKEIAARLDLQPTTVATYKARLFDKLGVSNVLDLQRLVSDQRTGNGS